ncbi:hypothetical protein L6452_39197 [Arctium lappa]|uniref:Uncharacterized protein n=1 Tax=Arctium lappa TaxID=4217 RepID=A0ACB8XR02_ARCLA|nr:hypothetical protein L6452_39197 [Arctium lappa]
MVAAVSSTTTTPNSKVSSRSSSPAVLLPSESDNNGHPPPRRPESRDVTSRYLSATASSNPSIDTMTSSSSSSSSSSTTTLSLNSVCTPRRRLPSMNHVSPASPVNNKRDQSVERHRSGNSHTGEMLNKTSARSLSVSFQGESFAVPVSKVAKPANNGLRNGTPERRKITVATPARACENSKPIDKQRWPGRSRQGSFMKSSGSGIAGAVEALRKSMTAGKTVNKLVNDSDNSDHAISDTDSDVRRGGRRAIAVPARFWQETINLLRRVQPESVSASPSKSNKLISGYKFLDDGPKLSPKGSPSSPVRGAIPLPSSGKRGIPLSPERNAVGCNSNLGNTPSILSFSVDSRRGKVGEKKLVDAHVLRLMHNKHLQWRFANAKIDAAMLVQQATAEKSLYNAWVTISKIWHSVISKRVEMQQLKQNLKLHSILKKQVRNDEMSYLDNWDLTDRDHSISLAGAIGALESSSLCLPVLSGAKADIQNLKDAICSAFDVMQAITVSICSLVTKVMELFELRFFLLVMIT